jgi:hypothetical protein
MGDLAEITDTALRRRCPEVLSGLVHFGPRPGKQRCWAFNPVRGSGKSSARVAPRLAPVRVIPGTSG